MLALGFVQGCLGFRRGLLTPFVISPPGGPFASALGLTALLLLLEIGGGVSGLPFADLGSGTLRQLCSAPFCVDLEIFDAVAGLAIELWSRGEIGAEGEAQMTNRSRSTLARAMFSVAVTAAVV
jgi:hypothetical protein